MRASLLISMILWVCIQNLNAQDSIISRIPVSSAFFTSDVGGNIYVFGNDSLFKYSCSGKMICSYPAWKHGKVSQIDVSDSSRIIVFYGDIQKVAVLNSLLREIMRPFFLDELGLFEISSVISSSKNSLWFYNHYLNTLIRFNQNFVPTVRGLDLTTFFDFPGSPSYFLQKGERLYLNIPSNGILVIDDNGKYVTAYDIPGLIDFQVSGNYIYYYRDGVLSEYDTYNRTRREILMPPVRNILNVRHSCGRLLIQTPGSILIYSTDYRWPAEVFSDKH